MKAEWDEERLTQLLRTRPYHQLTDVEREWIGEVPLSPEEYEELRSTELALSGDFRKSQTPAVSPEILKNLKEHLRSRQKTGFSWMPIFTYRVPAYVSATCVVLTFAITWFLQSGPRNGMTAQTVLTKRDTVFLPAVRDTVFVERVVYRDRYVKSPAVIQVTSRNTEKPDSNASGITMKDKEELEKLLVSGTY
jgi:hypothetical protein